MLRGSGVKACHERMSFQKTADRLLQLAGAVAVDDAHGALIGDERLVEEPLRARKRLVNRQPDHVEIRQHAFARHKIDVHAHGRGRRGRALFRRADDLQVLRRR